MEHAEQLANLTEIARRAHQDLRACIRGLVETAERADDEGLPHQLVVLRAALSEHFAHEESSPFYLWLPKTFPDYRDRIEKLRGQHAPMLANVNALERELSHSSRDQLKHRIESIVDALSAHEAAEDALLAELHPGVAS